MFDDIDDNEEGQKIIEAFLTFTTLFSKYIKESDPALFKKAVDYAKTYTEEDVSGIILNYIGEDDGDDVSKN